MSKYFKNFDGSKYMSFLINEGKLLETYNKIWHRASNLMKKAFDSKPVYNENYLRTKINSYDAKINPNFYDNGMPKEGSPSVCLPVKLINSAFEIGKNYYLHEFLEESKYVTKKNKMNKCLNDGL